ncbi:2287_t:CDS:2 [Funneliformis caledonium]|uniref:2287_t:CDS:1 n=1 Tax=Funneliformis caledonium TaxID=1117310 RepID=A0A9N9HEG5_9GLOM|nr:2287_t:CDS:2 [Funneliformis caledonium]
MQSLAAFMLTLIRQYEKSNSDMWMSIGLLMIGAGFHILPFRPSVRPLLENSKNNTRQDTEGYSHHDIFSPPKSDCYLELHNRNRLQYQ